MSDVYNEITGDDLNTGRRPQPAWPEVASYDTADAYEVDEGTVHDMGDGRYYLRWASGCSCWGGDYYSSVCDSLHDVVFLGFSLDRIEACAVDEHYRAEWDALVAERRKQDGIDAP